MVYRNFTFVEGESGTQLFLNAHAELKSIIAPSPLGREEFADVGQWVCDPVFMSDPRWIFLLVLIAIHLAFQNILSHRLLKLHLQAGAPAYFMAALYFSGQF